MVDVTIVGGGARVRDCGEVLCRSGLSLAHSFEIDSGNTSPIILGEVQGGYQLARQAIGEGRHLLIADPQLLTPERLVLLLEHRRPGQALFVWSDRRSHAGYRFVAGLRESDTTWRPRYIRQEVLSLDHPTSALFRWRALEALMLLHTLARQEPRRVTATNIVNRKRNAPELANLAIEYGDIEGHLLVALGEAMERRETLLASDTRKVYVDELNASMPIRIVDDDPASANGARWLSSMAPSAEELARQQCTAFLEACRQPELAGQESQLWRRSLGTLAAMEQSFANCAPVDVVVRPEPSRLRSVADLAYTPPSVA